MDEREKVRDVMEELRGTFAALDLDLDTVPKYYRRDGSIIVDTPEKSATIQWAEMFENSKGRLVAVDKTIYGERLSTVFLGLDHNFSMIRGHTPILFETMLFAPRSEEERKARREQIASTDLLNMSKWKESDEEKRIKKNYPHDNLQLRYATEREAKDRHEELKLQCLIPPRWRRFLLYTIGEDETWA